VRQHAFEDADVENRPGENELGASLDFVIEPTQFFFEVGGAGVQ
jgi:hypothetical protein